MKEGFSDAVAQVVASCCPGSDRVDIVDLTPIPGGFSRETFRLDAMVHSADGSDLHELILRKDPPHAQAILHTDRSVEHALIEAVRSTTTVPVTESLGYVMDSRVLGEPAMILRRDGGKSTTSSLFNGGDDEDQADDVVRHLCELLVELHETPIDALDPAGSLRDPRGVGIDPGSWESYMDTTFRYYIEGYERINREPGLCVLLDAFLTLRRHPPRPMPLSIVHGDFNPANFLYDNGRVTALIDWENSRVGDPREDLGWMMMMDGLSHTNVMQHPVAEGGFLAYYNRLRGLDITPEELGYFILFGTANIAIPVNEAIARRVSGATRVLLHLYMVQSSLSALPGMARLLNYPGVPAP